MKNLDKANTPGLLLRALFGNEGRIPWSSTAKGLD
jgi:hypothetical protein